MIYYICATHSLAHKSSALDIQAQSTNCFKILISQRLSSIYLSKPLSCQPRNELLPWLAAPLASSCSPAKGKHFQAAHLSRLPPFRRIRRRRKPR
jgi:hypothetical protein